MGFGDSRWALARTIWARRTRKASAVRRSASNWRRSSLVKGRIKSGGFITQVYQWEAQLHKNSCGYALATRFGGDVSDVAPLGAGVWSKAFAFRRAGRDYVLRVGAHQEDFAKDRLAARYA